LKRPFVLLYEPRHASARLPLSLLHAAAVVDAPVVVVDGRLELAPAALVAELARDALCLGVTTPTGAALADVLEVTRAAKAVRSTLPVLWGGPHATFRPEECLATGVVDACVIGPGERTLAEIVEALLAGGAESGIPGVAFLRGEEVARSLPRGSEDVNHLPGVDYGLLDLERHFRFRGARRVEIVTSRGDVPDGHWSGLLPERVLALVQELVHRHRVTEVVFSDQGFLADPSRAAAIAAALRGAGAPVTWEAATTLDDLQRARASLDFGFLRESGARRLTAWGAGALPPDLRELARGVTGAGIDLRVRFVVGCPGEPAQAPRDAYRAARELLALSPAVSVDLRLFEPWPGFREAEELLAAQQAVVPHDVLAWASFEPDRFAARWLPTKTRRSVPRWSFYLGHASRPARRRFGQRLVRRLARARVRTGFYGLDLERRAVLGLRHAKAALHMRDPRPVED